ncbi:MAG TPA: TRAP transporter small permease [Vicinamibacteria bacterium]|nr:TRAP transporter small permease [Vicinamibacteria bacterium]
MASSWLDRAESAVRTALACAASVTLAAIAGICFVEVVLRYGFGSSFGWYDEFVGYLLVWLTFLGAVLAQSQGQHIGIENLLDSAPDRLRFALRLANHAILVAIHLVLLVYGFQIVARLLTERAITLPIPMGYIYAVLPVSAIFMLLVESIQIARTLRAG